MNDWANMIESLRRPAAFPEPVAAVEVRHTHISVVFLTEALVYKIRKPVHLDFLDFTTLEKRLHDCQEEVRLNRRLARDVYLGVVPVVRHEDSWRFECQGTPVEWAVKMQRLPAEATMSQQLRRGELHQSDIERLARRIAQFHKGPPLDEAHRAHATFPSVSATCRASIDQATSYVGDMVSQAVHSQLRARIDELLERHRPLIEKRAERGMARDTHGDLHLDHVYYFPDRSEPDDFVIIDCVEFNERFRCIDPVADMAFLVMDLMYHGRRDLAEAFTDVYFEAVNDGDGRALLPLYSAYRATVRGLVDGIAAMESEVPAEQRDAARTSSRAHWLLALSLAEEPSHRPCLLMVGGLPGSGKSTLAKALAEAASIDVLRSDIIRKELADLASTTAAPADIGAGLYSSEWTEKTYDACLDRARALLLDGRRVIVDATFREDRWRETFLEAAQGLCARCLFFLCQAKPETMRERLASRHGDASDATIAVYEDMQKHWQPAGAKIRLVTHPISTEGAPETALNLATAVLAKEQLLNNPRN